MFGRPKDPAPRRRGGSEDSQVDRSSSGERRRILESIVGGSSVRPGARPPKPRLTDVAADWLGVIVALKRLTLLPDAEPLRARAVELKDKFGQAANAGGFSSADIEAATYALVVFLDETVLSAAGPGRDAWTLKPLQVQLFGTNVGGEEFFTRLERLRRERESRIDALEVYYCCLSFGFLGKYVLASADKLSALMNEVERDIAAVRGTPKRTLAPHVLRQDEIAGNVGSKFPTWLSLIAFAGGITLTWAMVALVSYVWTGRVIKLVEGLFEHH